MSTTPRKSAYYAQMRVVQTRISADGQYLIQGIEEEERLEESEENRNKRREDTDPSEVQLASLRFIMSTTQRNEYLDCFDNLSRIQTPQDVAENITELIGRNR